VDITLIQARVHTKEYYWRQHAIERSIERDIAEEEAAEAILNGEVIEEYLDDKYGPSCLIFGRTSEEDRFTCNAVYHQRFGSSPYMNPTQMNG
jgi:hypothetical protein